MISKGYYTTDNSDLYMFVEPKYKGADYMKCKITLFYKLGSAKGVMLEKKNYKVYYKNISHWVRYEVC